MNRRQFALATGATALAAMHRNAFAQSWPEKPVKLILSQPAGSGPDSMARMIGDQLARKWNQPVVIDNKPGGQNAIGAQAAAKSAPDGYTFYWATTAALVTNAYLFKSQAYDPRKDFTPVGMVGKVPFGLCVNANSKLRTLQDLVAYARANPEALAIANEGPKTFGGMMTRLLAAQLNLQVKSVPYVSVGAAVTDTIGGQTEALLSDLPAVAQMVNSGRLRVIAVTTGKRVAGFESAPPIADLVPGFDYAGWQAVVAPTGTPAAAIQRFNRDLDAVLSDKDMAARIQAIGPITEGAGTPEQMAAFLQAEHARWAKLTQDIGVLPE